MDVRVEITTERAEDGYWSGTAEVWGPNGEHEVLREQGFPSDSFARAMLKVMVNELTETLTWGRGNGQEGNR